MRIAPWALVIVAFVVASSASPAIAVDPTPTPTPTPQGLEPKDGTRSLNFGLDRDEQTITVTLTVDEALTAAPEADVSEAFTPKGHKRLRGTVKTDPVVLTQGGRTVKVVVRTDPDDHAEGGTYTAPLLVRGAGINDSNSTLEFTLRDAPGIWWLWAALLLFLGSFLGLLLKRITDKAGSLNGLWARYQLVKQATAGSEPWPSAFANAIAEIHEQLRREDVAAATTAVTAAEAMRNDVIQIAELERSMSASIARQQAIVDKESNPGDLPIVLGIERAWITDMRMGDISADATRQLRTKREDHVGVFENFLKLYTRPGVDQGPLNGVLAKFVQGDSDFDAAKEAWKNVPVDDQAARAAGPDGEPAEAAPPTQLTKFDKEPGPSFWVQNATWAVAVASAVILTLVGLLTFWDASTMFRAEAAKDVVTLFAWGVGSGVAGVALSEVAGKLTAKPA